MQSFFHTDSGTAAEAAAIDDWQTLAAASSAQELCEAWLPILCGMIPRVEGGLLLLEDGEGSYAPAALWPETRDLSYLRKIAEDALTRRQGVVERSEGGRVRFAYPLEKANTLFGVVILDLFASDDEALTSARRRLHWGAGWLLDLFGQRLIQEQQTRLDHSIFLLDLAIVGLSESNFGKVGLAVVNLLAHRFGCHQVLLGLEAGKSVRVEAMSHFAWFEKKANLVNMAGQAMNEAFDQRSRIVLPEPSTGPPLVTAVCRRYREESGSPALCVMPLEGGDRVAGVWLLERDEPFTEQELDLLETLGLVLGPILFLKLAREEGLFSHLRRAWSRGISRMTDTSHPGYKLIAILVAAVLAFTALFETEYRVASPAVVEGATRRVAVAPFDGYIQSASVRAGDVVHAGQILATLEDKDLRLEQVRWEAELEVTLRKEQEAMATSDRVELRLASAEIDQARAQLDLVRERLARIRLIAPFDGVVVRGDLSQKLGSPVQRGDVLFELAPMEAWRVILEVDERDIAYLQPELTGKLVLTSLPGRTYPLVVEKVTPVAVAEDGRNYFRIEAGLIGIEADEIPELRPNMEGVGKVEVGRHSLLWIWTRRVTEWLALAWWRWTP